MKKVKNFLQTKLGLFTEDGREVLDTTPVAIPVGFKRPDTLPELLARLHYDPRYQRVLDAGVIDSAEEADDFGEDDEIDGDFSDRRTSHEYAADQIPLRVQLRRAVKEQQLKKQKPVPEVSEAPSQPRRVKPNSKAKPVEVEDTSEDSSDNVYD